MPTWLLFLILLVVILIIVWILLSGNPVIEEDEESAVEDVVEEVLVEEVDEVLVVEEKPAAEPAPAVSDEEATANSDFDEVMEPLEEHMEPDDLKKIEGIGPKISGLLMENGIKTFAQLAEKDTEEIQAILDEAKIRIANPKTWAEQAKMAANGAWDSLEKLQDELKGGRREPK